MAKIHPPNALLLTLRRCVRKKNLRPNALPHCEISKKKVSRNGATTQRKSINLKNLSD